MIKTDKNIRDSYKIYKKKSESPIEIKDYIDLCNEYNKYIMERVFEGYSVMLPGKLGSFSIVGKQVKISYGEDGTPNLAPNWNKTKKLWARCPECKERRKLVYHTNEHSDGIRYKLIWSKKRVLIKHKTLYSLRLTRANKRRIYKEILNNKEYYVRS